MGGNSSTNKPRAGNKSSLQLRVKRIIDQETADDPDNFQFIGLENVVGNNSNCCLRFCWLILILTCVATCVYQIWERTAYYYTYPTYLSVAVKQRQDITYPPVTLCRDNGLTMRTRNSMAKKYGTKPCDYMDVDLIDFNLTGKNTPADKLWRSPLSAVGSIIQLGEEISSVRFQIPRVPLQPTKEVSTPLGLCLQDKTVNDSVLYRGTLTALFYATKGKTGCSYPQIIIGAEGHYLDPSSSRPFPLDLLVGLPIKKQEHIGLSTPVNPCVSEKEYWDCIIPCYDKLMVENIECRLPYMVNITKPTCTTSPDARRAHKLALKFMRNKYLDENCGCTKRCDVTTYIIRLETIADFPPLLIIYYPTSFVEVSEEQLAYDFDKLVCDVGGNLGLFLGFCLLSLVDSVQLFTDILIMKLCPNPKKRVSPMEPNEQKQMARPAIGRSGGQMQPNFERARASPK